MDERYDDELLAEMFGDIAFDALGCIGGDSELRFQFFKDFIALATRYREKVQLPSSGFRGEPFH
jgi:hypothetical protein